MADTYTAFLNLTRPEVGASRDAWGDKWNANATALDNWAKATDALAKDALAKSGVTTRDAQNNVVPVTQTVAGPLTLAEKPTLSKGATIPQAQFLNFGKGFFIGEAARTAISAIGDRLEIVNEANTAFILQATMGSILYRGGVVWHQGNFTPGNYADKTSAAQQVFTAPIEVQRNNPYIDLTYPDVMRGRQVLDAAGNWIFLNGDSGDNKFYVTQGGAVWTKQFGDLYTQIENRATAWANDRLAIARAEYAGHAKLAGAGFTGEISSPGITATGASGHISLQSRDGGKGALLYNAGSLFRIYDTAGADRAYFNLANGAIWSAQMGDLNSRIEGRAAAFADDRLATARAEIGLRVAKSGDTMTGDLTVSKANPSLYLFYGGIYSWRLWGGNDAVFRISNGDGAGDRLQLSPSGALWTAGIGDVYQRIEDRALAWANDRLAVARGEYANHAKTNAANTFTQDQQIAKAYPLYRMLYPGVRDVGWQVRENGGTYLWDFTKNNWSLFVGPGGDVQTSQLGDLNTRIEQRAAAFADDRLNTARTEASHITGRMTYAGDLDNSWNINQSYAEPYQGGVLTSRYTTSNQFIVDSWKGGRWRYMQMKGTDNSWYTISYA